MTDGEDGKEPWPDDIEGGWPDEPHAEDDLVVGGYDEDEDGREPWPDGIDDE